MQERFERLHAFQEEITLRDSAALEGRVVDVLVLDGDGRKGKGDRMSGREPGNRLVHFSVPEGADVPRPGDIVTVRISHGAPHHLIADPHAGGPYDVRRTRAGDAWEEAAGGGPELDSCGTPGAGGPVGLGLPRLRVAST